jgi:hypothetical protein
MSNDSIPHWPSVVVECASATIQDIIVGQLRRICKCPSHPNNDQVPTKEKKYITLYLTSQPGPSRWDTWDTTNLLSRVTGPHSGFVQLCHTVPAEQM